MTERGIEHWTDEEVVAFMSGNEPLARARSKFRSWAARVSRTIMQGGNRGGPINATKMEMQACLDIFDTMASGRVEPVAWQVVDSDVSELCTLTADPGAADIWRKAGLKVRPLYAIGS